MDYEKKYKEAIEKLRSLYNDYDTVSTLIDIKEELEYIFPELKDEDARIKACIGMCLTDANEQRFKDYDTTLKDCLVWLEKQDEPIKINPSEFDLRLNKLLKQFETLPKEELASSLDFYLNVLRNNGTYKQGDQKLPIEKLPEEMKTIEESLGFTTQKECDEYNQMVSDLIMSDDKVEQKHTCLLDNSKSNVKFPFKAKVKRNGKIVTIHGGQLSMDGKKWIKYQSDKEDGYMVYEPEDLELVYNIEQKPVDKIEPKFKVGDWVVCEGCEELNTAKIVNINGDRYEVEFIDGDKVFHHIDYIDKIFHLWSIKDAKNGDVLVAPPIKGQEGTEQIFIFKEINNRDYVDNCIEYYCRICEGVFYENKNGYMGTTSSPKSPATKEQRDLLFQKMTEAEYEWDAEKKELKKIETEKSVWGEDDEKINNLCHFLEEYGNQYYGHLTLQCTISWLKSIKQRIEWKPSDEQMKALYEETQKSDRIRDDRIVSLYNDLKKLKSK